VICSHATREQRTENLAACQGTGIVQLPSIEHFNSVGWTRAGLNSSYSEVVTNNREHIDKPEPRWQALLALLATGGLIWHSPLL
jgi:hypothetical protein